MKKKSELTIPSALRAISMDDPALDCNGILIDAKARSIVAADGIICAIIPVPDGIPLRTSDGYIPFSEGDITISGDLAGVAQPPVDFDWRALTVGIPAYRVALDARRLLQLAEAIGCGDVILLTLPKELSEAIEVSAAWDPQPDGPRGFIMPGNTTLSDGPLISVVTADPGLPTILVEKKLNIVRQSLELHFTGKPSKEVREEIKDQSYRWYQQGGFWYAKDTPGRHRWTDEFVARQNGIPIDAAA